MARVTSKLQVTIPKVVADRYQIGPGAELVFEPAGDAPQRRQTARPINATGESGRSGRYSDQSHDHPLSKQARLDQTTH